ncbi:MAG: hypothetical protein ACKOI2_09530, partial [Actinomycetota bacterium]
VLTSCSSSAIDKSQVDSVASSTETINAALPTQLRNDQMPVYEMAMQFLSQTIAVSPGLRKKVGSVEPIAICMVLAGYQINNIPPPSGAGSPSTVVPPETMIAPMLTYLTESCTQIPSSEWQKE